MEKACNKITWVDFGSRNANGISVKCNARELSAIDSSSDGYRGH